MALRRHRPRRRLHISDKDGTPAHRASRFPQHIGSFDRIAFPLNLLCGFAPFVAFTILAWLSISLSLWTAFAAAFALGLPVFLHTRTVRTLDGGGIALFGLMAILSGFLPALTNFGTVRFVVAIGMLATVITSFIRREPFAMQYTHDADPAFVQRARWISAIWAITFVVLTGMDATSVYVHGTPEPLVILVNFAALAAATVFTLRRPGYIRDRK
jgi:hypothetical protein